MSVNCNPRAITHAIVLLLAALFSFSSLLAFDNDVNGSITGIVTTADNKPAPFVTVNLKGTKKSVLTAEDGSFTLHAPAGSYTLEVALVGHQSTTQEITVQSRQVVKLAIQLAVSEIQLEEVTVSSGGHKLYQKETEYVARMPLSNLENPQVYSVITKDLLKEMVITDPREAMKNVTGAAISNYPAGGFSITSRGFSTGINARNGMETVASRSSIEMGNIERIEVLKGPSGTLFGAAVSSFGGVVNLVTKKPLETFKGDVSYTFGSFGLNRLAADINTPLDKEKKALFRINTVVNRQNSFLNYGFNNTFLIAPSLSYKVSDRFTVLADAEFLNINQTRTAYTRTTTASGFTNASQIPLAYNKSLYMDDADAKSFASKFFLEGRYKMSGTWTSSTVFSFVSEQTKQSYQYYPTWTSPTTVSRNVLLYGPIFNNYTNGQQNFNGTVYTGRLKHNINLGANIRYYNGSFIYTSTGTTAIDVVDITKTWTAVSKAKMDQHLLQNGAVLPNPVSNQTTYSVYGTDVVSLTDRLSVLLSARIDWYNYKGVSAADGYKQTSFAPKLGLVYQVVKEQLSVFGNYMSGFQNLGPQQNVAPATGLFVPKPVFANQAEGGIKGELLHKKLNFNLSYYYINIDNALRLQENGYYTQDGKQVSKGIEAEINANPVAGLNIIAGYAYNDNRIVKSATKSIEGNLAAGAPYNVANVWVSYKFQIPSIKNLGVGVGGNYVDQAYMSTDNIYYFPCYSAVNAGAFYDQPQWRLGFKVNNIGSRKAWDLSGAPQPLINFAGDLTIRF